MRKSLWLTALALGFCLAGTASAQTTATSQSASSSPGIGLANYLRDTFGLANIFAPFTFINKVQTPGPSSIPNPNSPAYFQAFGYRKLY